MSLKTQEINGLNRAETKISGCFTCPFHCSVSFGVYFARPVTRAERKKKYNGNSLFLLRRHLFNQKMTLRRNELTTGTGVDHVLDRSTIDARVNIPFSFAFSLVPPTTMRRHYKITGPLATDRTDRLSRSIACVRIRVCVSIFRVRVCVSTPTPIYKGYSAETKRRVNLIRWVSRKKT